MRRTHKPSLAEWSFGFGCCVAITALAGCDGISVVPPENADGAALAKIIMDTDPYQQWAQFPNVQGTVASAFPHGPMARVFINAQVEVALAGFNGALPNGSIIVKENLGDSTTDKADALTVMWKVPSFDPDNNDWFWANLSANGQVNAEGKIATCTGCHNAARGNDFVFLHQF